MLKWVKENGGYTIMQALVLTALKQIELAVFESLKESTSMRRKCDLAGQDIAEISKLNR
ncbi:hypothetical protein DY000_02022524 [Brassica cretica]|uniref:Histone H2A/H2B/H3 domain-containing protein n=1 Tax=Brassica cretica TaxID=69181 RepID=A0ABQ7EH13_BRACR|nr:hypothetical protein DY000_02022524 [Brassica cretica]